MGRLRRLVPLPHPEGAVRVDPPGEVDPELVLLPHLAGVGLVGALVPLSGPLTGHPQHGLAEAEPAGCMGLVGVGVVALGAYPHR